MAIQVGDLVRCYELNPDGYVYLTIGEVIKENGEVPGFSPRLSYDVRVVCTNKWGMPPGTIWGNAIDTMLRKIV